MEEEGKKAFIEHLIEVVDLIKSEQFGDYLGEPYFTDKSEEKKGRLTVINLHIKFTEKGNFDYDKFSKCTEADFKSLCELYMLSVAVLYLQAPEYYSKLKLDHKKMMSYVNQEVLGIVFVKEKNKWGIRNE